MRRFRFLRHVQQMAKNKNSHNYDRVTESKLLIQDKSDQSSLFENKLILSSEIFSVLHKFQILCYKINHSFEIFYLYAKNKMNEKKL